MTGIDSLEVVARRLRAGLRTFEPDAPVRSMLPAGEVAKTYAVQRITTEHRANQSRTELDLLDQGATTP